MNDLQAAIVIQRLRIFVEELTQGLLQIPSPTRSDREYVMNLIRPLIERRAEELIQAEQDPEGGNQVQNRRHDHLRPKYCEPPAKIPNRLI